MQFSKKSRQAGGAPCPEPQNPKSDGALAGTGARNQENRINQISVVKGRLIEGKSARAGVVLERLVGWFQGIILLQSLLIEK